MRALFLLLAMTGPVWAADPIEGVWRTQANGKGGTGLVRIAPCGEGFCGTVIGDLDAAGRTVASDIQGAVVLREVEREGRTYGVGEVIDPSTGRAYAARLVLEGDSLDVGGCLLGICRSAGVWRRLD